MYISHTIHATSGTFYLHEWLIVKVNAGKYTIPIDAMSMMKIGIYTLLIDGPSQHLYIGETQRHTRNSRGNQEY